MKEAFAHCRLLPGGAQVVLQDIIAHTHSNHIRIFTFISSERSITIKKKTIHITTVLPTWLNNFLLWCTNKDIPIVSSIFDYRNFIIFAPLRAYIMSRQIKKYAPDKIYISSFARSKNINTYGVKTTLYLHSPMQYIWTHAQEYANKITGRKGWIFRLSTHRLKEWDKKPREYNKVVSNSKYTAIQAEKIYGLQSTIQYPPIQEEIQKQEVSNNTLPYFIYTGRLVTFVKELDVIIQACNETNTQLIIMGDGPDKQKLQKMAGGTIIFIPWIHNIYDRIKIIQQSRGLINITKESFGISTMETLLLGVPVLGYNGGASKELVDGNSGILIDTKDVKTLIDAIKTFENKKFNKKNIQDHARMLYNKNRRD